LKKAADENDLYSLYNVLVAIIASDLMLVTKLLENVLSSRRFALKSEAPTLKGSLIYVHIRRSSLWKIIPVKIQTINDILK